jgi:hypothetical protein
VTFHGLSVTTKRADLLIFLNTRIPLRGTPNEKQMIASAVIALAAVDPVALFNMKVDYRNDNRR